MKSPESDELLKAIDEINAQAYESPAPSFEEYQRRLGIYQGLRMAVNIVIAVNEEPEDD